VNGRSYVDVEAITRLLDGSLRFQGTRVVLTLPSQQAAVPASAPAPVPVVTASPGLSRDFVSTGVGAVSVMREWHAALAFAIGHDQPVTEDLLAPYERRAQAQVQLAFAAARTDDDRAAGTLYSNLLGSLQALSNSYVSTHDQIRNIRTDALDNDTANTAAVQCLATLGSLNPGMRADEISACH
jgi:hypothetical protein